MIVPRETDGEVLVLINVVELALSSFYHFICPLAVKLEVEHMSIVQRNHGARVDHLHSIAPWGLWN
ncbi:hypothetical protein BD410DRAFT_784649 [Rickenella mellea]|uniref:Uncharacterized protein n=1 Tax=Rickenella mellea TaxID=50990 RepID=A0A4Y7QDY6_9AGAM|nr:hypothetical protein BD410DRAFT_784649 [Rickenella mellea]